jgi:hypothetical protein
MEKAIKRLDNPSARADERAKIDASRRAMLRKLGRFAAVTPPAVTLLLSARIRPAAAASPPIIISSRQFKEPVSLAPGPRRT